MNLGKLTGSLNGTYSRYWVCKHFSDIFTIKSVFKQEGVLSPLISKSALGHTIWKIQASQEGLKLNSAHQLLGYANDINTHIEWKHI
jgi:hypothetical protein